MGAFITWFGRFISVVLFSLFSISGVDGQTVTTVAGGNGAGAAENQLNMPHDIVFIGDTLYIADMLNHRIQKVASDGTVTTVLGGNGAGNASNQLNQPIGVAAKGDTLLVADHVNHRIQKLSPDGTVTTIDAGPLSAPVAIEVKSDTLFISDRNNGRIQKVVPDGTVSTVTAGSLNFPHDVAIKGDTLYIADLNNHRIQKLSPDGTVTTVVGGNGQGNGANQLDRPHSVAFRGDSLYIMDTFNDRVQRLSPNGTVATVFGGNGRGDALNQLNLALGLVFKEDTLFIADVSNHRIQRVVFDGAPDLQIAGKIAFNSERDGNSEIYTVNPDGTGVTSLTNNTDDDFWGDWSPDGKRIVFDSVRNGANHIYVMNADGTNEFQLTDSNEDNWEPRWSPDGKKIAFQSNRDGDRDIFVMDADGSNQVQLMDNTTTDVNADWSPDGTKIVFAASRSGASQIWIMDADGSNPVNLSNTASSDTQPHFSPDGKKIVFDSNRDGAGQEIYVMNADGSNPIRQTTNSLNNQQTSWSPDGKKIVFHRGADNEIYRITSGGGNLVRLTNNAALDSRPAWQQFRHIGTAPLNTPVSRNMTIENPGTADLTVSDITSDNGQFTMSPTSFTVSPGSSQDVSVAFTPTSTGTKYATLSIESNDPDSPTISLIVNGIGQTPANAQSPTKIYWTDAEANKIQRADLDGSHVEDLITGSISPGSMALDISSDKIYWTNPGLDKIQRSNLDGTGIEDLVTGLGFPETVILDVPAGKMYWSDSETDKIQRSNLDGSNVEDIVTAASGLLQPIGLALNKNGKIYWTDQIADKIQRSNLDGSNIEDVISTNLSGPTIIALDITDSKMYWTDVDTDKIYRADLDGTNVEELVTPADGLSQPRGISLDVNSGKMYWTDRGTDKIQRANLNGTNIEDLVTGLSHPNFIILNIPDNGGFSNGTFPVTIAIDTTFAAPGQSAKLDLTLDNTGSSAVGGAQFNVYLGDMTKATFTGFADTLMAVNGGFTVSATVSNDTLKVVVLSGSGAVLDPGVHVIGRLCFDLVADNAHLGMELPVSIDAVEVSNQTAQTLPTMGRNGLIQIGIRGDLTLDGRVSIVDIVALVRLNIGTDPAPEARSTAFNIADVNGDESLNIVDVIAQVNIILGLPPSSKLVSSPISASLDAPIILPDGRPAIPLSLHGDGLAGMQASLRFDPTVLSLDRAIFAADQEGLLVESHIENGIMRLTAVDLNGNGLPVESVIYIPVTMIGETGVITLGELIPANRHAHALPVQITTAAQTVSGKDASLPISFALHSARPNPFNPSTVIAYDVPEQAYITLIVYNLLGQEVARLVDRVQSAGRYQAVWQGVNTQDRGVSSGVYLYRLSSSTGYSESRRMTLLK